METLVVAVSTISDIQITDRKLTFCLEDGREVSVPLAWYPRLEYATPEERSVFEIWPSGQSCHWPLLDEHIGVDGLLAGKRSGESQASLERWQARLEKRRQAERDSLDPDVVEPWVSWRPLPDDLEDEA
ncbi:MAG: DUF2442 domain-containing protein [Rhodothermales bacterium]